MNRNNFSAASRLYNVMICMSVAWVLLIHHAVRQSAYTMH